MMGTPISAISNLKAWHLVHKWTSLACTLFLLVICVTGLPLVFSDEIDGWLSDDPPYAALPPFTPMADLDVMVHAALRRYPGQAVRSVFIDDDEPQVLVTLAPTLKAAPEFDHALRFDARTGQFLKAFPPAAEAPSTFMDILFRLHTDLFARLPGQLFLAFVALLFVASVVSGVVLYGPFMKRLPFGTVRRARGPRLRWLDLHNLLGIATLVWAAVVGATGLMNELSVPLFDLWRVTAVRTLLAAYHDKPAPKAFYPLQTVFDTVQSALPGQVLVSIEYPDPQLDSPHHYVVWTKGNTPLTSQLFTPALVDAEDGRLTAVARLPWYLKLLEISRPLHFGDYGGLPFKFLWAGFDLATIVVLGSGLYLWLKKRSVPFEQQLIEEAELEPAGPA
jgi:uncharacterized iron-regulated membrane protein